MKLRLIDIAQADQLAAGNISLLMGVLTPKNLIQEFLSMTRAILKSKTAALIMQNEPYLWHESVQGFKAYPINQALESDAYFPQEIEGNKMDMQLIDYQAMIRDLREQGLSYEQLTAFDLKTVDQSSYGQLIIFDGDEQALHCPEKLELIGRLVKGFVQNIELHLEFDELKQKYEKQRILSESKTKFFQIIAHDLRAPFHGLLGFSEILAKERHNLDDASIQDMTEYLYDTAQSTYNLLENLLNWAMAEGGHLVFQPKNFYLKQSSTVVYDVLNAIAQKKNIELIENVAEDLKVYADQNMVTSVIQNLVSNALKFTPKDGTGKVYIHAEKKEKTVEILVQDTGVGMTEAQILSISQPDIKVSFRGTSGEKGTGLGLVLCKRFIDLNRGQLIVSSKQGAGTTVKVILPIARATPQRILKY